MDTNHLRKILSTVVHRSRHSNMYISVLDDLSSANYRSRKSEC